MPEQNPIQYSADDIRRYHSGEMPKAEMHAMEKAALEDPFLADAMEGYPLTPDFEGDIRAIQARMNEKTSRKVVPIGKGMDYRWMRIAALFMVMAVAGWLIFRSGTNDNKLATQNAPAENNVVLHEGKTEVPAASPVTDTPAEETYVPVKENVTITAAAPNVKKVRLGKTNSISRSLPPVEADTMIDVALTADQAEVAVPQAYVNAQKSRPRLNKYSGYVTDEKRNAIPYASVIVKNHSGTLTDDKGRFELAVPDTASAVDVNAIGYLSRNVNLREARTSEPIVLQPASEQLQEVVVARDRGMYRAKTTARKSIIEVGDLEPIGGWPAYNDYISERLNLTINTESKSKTPSGIVQLSFDVDEEGNPTNITVEKSLCPSCDREAIRLLKEGPKWKREQGKGKVSIRF